MRVFCVQGVVLVGAFSLAIVACGGDAVEGDDATTSVAGVESVDTTVATISPSTTAASTTSTVAASTTTLEPPVDAVVVPLESVVGGTIRGEGWLVEPGNYSAELGSSRYTFAITEAVVYFASDARITFGPDTSSSVTDMFLLTNFAGVIPASEAGVHAPHDPLVPSYTAPVPENLGTWLSSVAQFSPGDQLDVATDGGVTARAWM